MSVPAKTTREKKTKAKEFNCQKKCGRCCVICTHIGLKPEEIRARKYRTQEAPNEKGRRILKRRKAFIIQLDRKVYACYYLDPFKMECTIYERRPLVCRAFNCDWEPKIQKIWNDLKKGSEKPACVVA